MAYTTLSSLSAHYGADLLLSLTDRGETATGEINEGTVTDAIASAEALIDGYIGKKYLLPLTVTPPLISRIARQIAICDLHVYSADDKIEAAQKAAIRQLEQISQGMIVLDAAGARPASTDGGSARVTDRERPMTETTLKSFI